MPTATTDDVQARAGRALTTGETARAAAFLIDASAECNRVAPWTTEDPGRWADARISVECSMVLRAMRIPDALTAVVPGTDQTGFPVSTSTGEVFLRLQERRKLGVPSLNTVNVTPSAKGDGTIWSPIWSF